jgi:hypothetical protein
MRNTAILVLALAGSLSAQTLSYAPFGTETKEGNTNNTIPWWSASGTYQQLHDATDLTNVFSGGQFALINSIGLRKDGLSSTTPAARTLDVQITLGTTGVSAASATSNFASNMGVNSQIVLPYTTVNLPSLSNTSIPNQLGWNFPFSSPYPYVVSQGNLCWEIRFLNNTSTASSPLDAANTTGLINYTPFGGGCVATGQSTAAAIGLRSASLTTGLYRNRLDRGPATAPAAFWVGVAPQQVTLPGLCAALEFLPFADVPGMTDAAGQWDLQLTFPNLNTVTDAEVYGQFVFLDGGLPFGFGLSDASRLQFPFSGAQGMARIYAAPSQGGAGNELATDGSVGLR